jgi:hypothetical protein
VRYSVYGLCLDADLPLPGLIPCDDDRAPDVVFRLQVITAKDDRGARTEETLFYQSDWLDEFGEPGLEIHRSAADRSFRLHYNDGVEFVIHPDGHVLARTPAALTLADVSTYLTGPVLGFLLRMRGVVSLHASAIEIGGIAVAFVGEAGAGKSTTAAMFARLGCNVITEDVAALTDADGRFMVRSGYADVALCPDAVRWLFGSPDALPERNSGLEKRRLDLAATGAFAGRSVPLGAVYLLADRGGPHAPCVSPVSTGEAMVRLLGNIYGNRMFHEQLRVHELDVIHRIVGTVPVRAATAGADGDLLERFCEVILDDVS